MIISLVSVIGPCMVVYCRLGQSFGWTLVESLVGVPCGGIAVSAAAARCEMQIRKWS